MTRALVMIPALAACFFAAVLNLAADSRFRRILMRAAAIGAVAIGAVLYGYGYAYCMGLGFTSFIRALLALCRMFGGVNDLASVQDAPLFRIPAVQAVFWLGHFLAFYLTASAAIAALGEKLLRRIRATLLRRGPLTLIYGVNANSVAFGRRAAQEKRRAVIFVDPDSGADGEGAIASFGGVTDRSADAVNGTVRFLKRINMRPGKRRLELAALHEDGRKNLEYARVLLASMDAKGIRPEQTSLLVSGAGEAANELQALGGSGYGDVYAFDEYDLVARMMTRDHPPCETIRFDASGRAAEDLHAVILGFGRMGRAVLFRLIANGQFLGSRFRADVFDPGPQNGFLHAHPILSRYDVRFHPEEGTSDGFYDFMEKHRDSVRLVVLCTGSAEKNREIAGDLVRWCPRGERMPLLLHATKERYCAVDGSGRETQSPRIFDRDGLDLIRMDAMAMQVNRIYRGGKDPAAAETYWRECGYADRQSSRASADFYPAVLRASGKTPEQVLAGDWPPEGELLENLSVTEHLRWCAYVTVAGYAPMPPEVWRERADRYLAGKAAGDPAPLRIGRDDERRLQACLIPWEELDELSARENAVTGGSVDYKQMDRNNVLMLKDLLTALRGGKGPDA